MPGLPSSVSAAVLDVSLTWSVHLRIPIIIVVTVVLLLQLSTPADVRSSRPMLKVYTGIFDLGRVQHLIPGCEL